MISSILFLPLPLNFINLSEFNIRNSFELIGISVCSLPPPKSTLKESLLIDIFTAIQDDSSQYHPSNGFRCSGLNSILEILISIELQASLTFQ